MLCFIYDITYKIYNVSFKLICLFLLIETNFLNGLYMKNTDIVIHHDIMMKIEMYWKKQICNIHICNIHITIYIIIITIYMKNRFRIFGNWNWAHREKIILFKENIIIEIFLKYKIRKFQYIDFIIFFFKLNIIFFLILLSNTFCFLTF